MPMPPSLKGLENREPMPGGRPRHTPGPPFIPPGRDGVNHTFPQRPGGGGGGGSKTGLSRLGQETLGPMGGGSQGYARPMGAPAGLWEGSQPSSPMQPGGLNGLLDLITD